MLFAALFAQLSSHDLQTVLTLAVLGATGFAISVPGMAIFQWRVYRQRQLGAVLVQEMLCHGMTATDIERVLLAWSADPQEVAKLWRERLKEERNSAKAKIAAK